MMDPPSAVVQVDVVFDGACGVCTRAAAWLERMDRGGHVRLFPLQRPGVLERYGLTEAEARSALWAFPIRHGVSPRVGRPCRGAAAANLAADAAFGTRVCVGIYWLPGMRWLQDRVYAWVANHRYLFRGASSWCAEHPADCGAPENG